jgi:hypothetical protein
VFRECNPYTIFKKNDIIHTFKGLGIVREFKGFRNCKGILTHFAFDLD